MIKDTYSFISHDTSVPQLSSTCSERYYGPTMNAYEAAEKAGKVDELHNQLLDLASAQNKSTNGGTSISATFLKVTVWT